VVFSTGTLFTSKEDMDINMSSENNAPVRLMSTLPQLLWMILGVIVLFAGIEIFLAEAGERLAIVRDHYQTWIDLLFLVLGALAGKEITAAITTRLRKNHHKRDG